MSQRTTLDISWGTILRIGIIFFSLYLIFLIKDILVLSVFGLVISILFEIPIRFLERRIPRSLAVVVLYGLTFLCISLIIYLPASKFIDEIRQFVNLFPTYFEKASPVLRNLGLEAFENLETFVDSLENLIQAMTSNIFSVLVSIFGGVASTVFVVSIAVFLSLEGKSMEQNLILLFPREDEDFVTCLWQRCQKRVGFWFLRSIISSLFVGIFTFIAFYILKTKYPLVLGLVAGAMNFIPVIGPIFASFLIFVVLALDSATKAFIALIVSILIQQIENSIVTPLITKKLVGLSPVLVLISLTVGAQLFGFLGAILAIPLVGVITEFSRGLLERKRGEYVHEATPPQSKQEPEQESSQEPPESPAASSAKRQGQIKIQVAE